MYKELNSTLNLSRVEFHSCLVEFKGAYGSLLHRCSRNQTLLDNLSSAHNSGFDASVLHVEDGISCAMPITPGTVPLPYCFSLMSRMLRLPICSALPQIGLPLA